MTRCECVLHLVLTLICSSLSVCLSVCICIMSICLSISTQISSIDLSAAAAAVVVQMMIETVAKWMMLMTMMMMLIMRSSVHTTASKEQLTYCPVSAPDGTRLCAVTSEPSEMFDVDKLSRCAIAAFSSQTTIFNYNLTYSQCTLIHSSNYQLQASDDCHGYEVIHCTQ